MAIVINGNGIDMGNSPISNVDIQNDVDVVDKEYVDTNIINVINMINFGSTGAYGLKWNQETDIYEKLGATDRTQIQKNMKRCVLKDDGTVNYYLDPYDRSNIVTGKQIGRAHV